MHLTHGTTDSFYALTQWLHLIRSCLLNKKEYQMNKQDPSAYRVIAAAIGTVVLIVFTQTTSMIM